MDFLHLIILCFGDNINLRLGSFQLDLVSSFQLRDLSLESFVLLVRGDDLVGELLADDVRDVITLLVTFVQQLKTSNDVYYVDNRNYYQSINQSVW